MELELLGLQKTSQSENPERFAYEDGEFEWYDYFIFTLTLMVSLGIGVYYAFAGDKQKTTKEYLMGNRSLGTIPVAMSMFMSYISAILVLGNTAEMYTHGIQQWLAMFGSSFAYALSAILFVPLFFPLNITSSFEYLEMRFKSRAVKLTGTILLMISQVMYMGIAMYSPATALDAVTPIPVWAAIVATGVVGTVYTTIGGMKAVVWTDVFQGLVLLGGLLAVLIVGAIEVGGLGEVFRVADEAGRIFINWEPDPTVRMTFWSVIVGRTISSMQTTGTGQTSVQRYCALPTLRKAQTSVFLNIPFMLIVYSLTCIVGLTVFSYYWVYGCDPLRSGQISSSNQLLPFFIVDVLKTPALPGLFVAVLFSGCLSSVSSSMNSLSAVTWKDMMEWKFYYIPEWKKALITKGLAAGYGVLAVAFAFVVGNLGGHVLQASQSFVSGVAGPLLGIFILGSWFPWSNKYGALCGAWIGLSFNLVVIIGNYIVEPHVQTLNTTMHNCSKLGFNETTAIPIDPEDIFGLFKMSFMWFSALGALTCVVIGLIVSLITGVEKASEQNPLLFIPIFDRLICCLPRSVSQFLWCGVRYEDIELDEDGHVIKDEEEEEEGKGIQLDDHLKGTPLGYVATVEDDTNEITVISANGVQKHSKQNGQAKTESIQNFFSIEDDSHVAGNGSIPTEKVIQSNQNGSLPKEKAGISNQSGSAHREGTNKSENRLSGWDNDSFVPDSTLTTEL